MIHEGMRIQDVRYDAARRCYHGAVTIFEQNGIFITQVSTPGAPHWGYARTLDALAEAGVRARTTRAPVPSA